VIGRIFAAYVAECIKYSRLFFPYFGPVFVILAVLGTLLIQPIEADGVSDLGFIGAAVPAALNIVGFLMLLIYAAGLLNITGVVSAWALVALLGEASGIDFGGELIYTGQDMSLALLIAAVLNLAPHLTAAAYAIMISTLVRRTATAIGAAVGGWLLVDYIKHALRFDEFIFSTYLDQSWIIYSDRCKGLATPFTPEAYYGLAVCAVWFVLFTGIAFAVIRRRNFSP
jgi:hypothetical protein